MTAGLPAGFSIVLDPDTKSLDKHTLFGGSPARIMRISESGRTAMAELLAGEIRSANAGVLARRLTDAGVAHPRPPDVDAGDVTVIIPVYGRTELLDNCLLALGNRYPVLVVDDASPEPGPIAEIARKHGARLVRRERNGGPGAARNTGLPAADSEFVAFLDSDCVPDTDWIGALAAHFADPMVAAVAPRIVAGAGTTLDMGAREGRVVPASRLSYVPTAALLVRRAALDALDGPFDAGMRVGEDVDLIWRLHEDGWRIRYDPRQQVEHHEPRGQWALLKRRWSYGTSAAPLAIRHPNAMSPLALHPWPTLSVAALLARRPGLAAAAFAAGAWTTRNALVRKGIPARGVIAATASAVRQTWLGTGRYCCQFATPLLLLGITTGRPGRRAAVASLLLGPAVNEWLQARPGINPLRFTAARLADDIAYGAGVWTGAWRHRTLVPVRPTLMWRSERIEDITARANAHLKRRLAALT